MRNAQHTKAIVLFCLFGLFQLSLKAQCTMVCNGMVNIALGSSGIAVVLPNEILNQNQSVCPGPKIVSILEVDGTPIGDTLTCLQTGLILQVTVTDVATSNSCWGSIQVEEIIPPIISCTDTTVFCYQNTSPDSLGYPSATDNCGPIDSLYFFDELSTQFCSGDTSAVITRNWTAMDANGNSSSCVQNIYLLTGNLADVEFPENLDNINLPALDCSNPDFDPSNTGEPHINGNPLGDFCALTTSYTDLTTGGCDGKTIILRQWTVNDWCNGLIETGTQIIKALDTIPPTLTCPDTIQLITTWNACSVVAELPSILVEDNCSDSITVRVESDFGILFSNGGTVEDIGLGYHSFNYIAVDDCDNVDSCELVVQVIDFIAPTVICDETTTITLPSSGLATLSASTFDQGTYDNCCLQDSFLIKRMSEPDSLFAETITFNCDDDAVMVVLQAFDCVGLSNQCMIEVTVEDKNNPIIQCPADVTILCTEDQFDTSLTGLPAAFDNCAVIDTSYVDLDNTNLCNTGTITRTWTVEDPEGFTASCSHVITLIDTTEPIVEFPADLTIAACDLPMDEIEAGEPTFSDNCGLIGVSQQDSLFNGDCFLKIIRTWTLVDLCSSFDTSYVQVIKIIDEEPPVIITPVGALDSTFSCASDVVIPIPEATDICDDLVIDLIDSDTIPGACSDNFQINLTYRAMDLCGNVSENYMVSLTVEDNIAPTASSLPNQGPFACVEDLPLPNVIFVTNASDNCGGPVDVTYIGDSPNPGCNGTIIRTYQLEDQCGNTSLVQQNFEISDQIAPNLICPPDTVIAIFPSLPNECEEFVNIAVSPSDNCFFTGLSVANDSPFAINSGADASGTYPVGTTTVTFTATDFCGNAAFCSTNIEILDSQGPQIDCQPLSVELNAQGIFVLDLDFFENMNLISDACSEVTIQVTPDTLTCNEIPGTSYTLFAQDAFGNPSSCSNTVDVSDPLGICPIPPDAGFSTLYGMTQNYLGTPISNVTLELFNNDMNDSDDSADNGMYLFTDVDNEYTYTLTANKDDTALNGVSTYDMVKIAQHILGTSQLESPYQMIAADINNSGTISTIDMVELRKVILQIQNDFSNNENWKFIPADFEFTNPDNPFEDEIPNHIDLNDLSTPMIEKDFICIKIGDINGSAN